MPQHALVPSECQKTVVTRRQGDAGWSRTEICLNQCLVACRMPDPDVAIGIGSREALPALALADGYNSSLVGRQFVGTSKLVAVRAALLAIFQPEKDVNRSVASTCDDRLLADKEGEHFQFNIAFRQVDRFRQHRLVEVASVVAENLTGLVSDVDLIGLISHQNVQHLVPAGKLGSELVEVDTVALRVSILMRLSVRLSLTTPPRSTVTKERVGRSTVPPTL